MTAEQTRASPFLQRVAMQDADVFYLDRLAFGCPDSELLQRLIAEVPWRREEVVMWGRRVPQPRGRRRPSRQPAPDDRTH